MSHTDFDHEVTKKKNMPDNNYVRNQPTASYGNETRSICDAQAQ